MAIDRVQLDAIKKQFMDCNVNEDIINAMLNKLNEKIFNKKFNPHKNNTMLIYDIMDDVQGWQDDMGKIFKEALKYKEVSELLQATITSIYSEEEGQYYISDTFKNAVRDNNFKNGDEKKAWIFNQLNKSCNIGEDIKFAKEHVIKSEYALKKAQNMSDIIEKQDNKVSRKISMIHEEVVMGVLTGAEVKDVMLQTTNKMGQDII